MWHGNTVTCRLLSLQLLTMYLFFAIQRTPSKQSSRDRNPRSSEKSQDPSKRSSSKKNGRPSTKKKTMEEIYLDNNPALADQLAREHEMLLAEERRRRSVATRGSTQSKNDIYLSSPKSQARTPVNVRSSQQRGMTRSSADERPRRRNSAWEDSPASGSEYERSRSSLTAEIEELRRQRLLENMRRQARRHQHGMDPLDDEEEEEEEEPLGYSSSSPDSSPYERSRSPDRNHEAVSKPKPSRNASPSKKRSSGKEASKSSSKSKASKSSKAKGGKGRGGGKGGTNSPTRSDKKKKPPQTLPNYSPEGARNSPPERRGSRSSLDFFEEHARQPGSRSQYPEAEDDWETVEDDDEDDDAPRLREFKKKGRGRGGAMSSDTDRAESPQKTTRTLTPLLLMVTRNQNKQIKKLEDRIEKLDKGAKKMSQEDNPKYIKATATPEKIVKSSPSARYQQREQQRAPSRAAAIQEQDNQKVAKYQKQLMMMQKKFDSLERINKTQSTTLRSREDELKMLQNKVKSAQRDLVNVKKESQSQLQAELRALSDKVHEAEKVMDKRKKESMTAPKREEIRNKIRVEELKRRMIAREEQQEKQLMEAEELIQDKLREHGENHVAEVEAQVEMRARMKLQKIEDEIHRLRQIRIGQLEDELRVRKEEMGQEVQQEVLRLKGVEDELQESLFRRQQELIEREMELEHKLMEKQVSLLKHEKLVEKELEEKADYFQTIQRDLELQINERKNQFDVIKKGLDDATQLGRHELQLLKEELEEKRNQLEEHLIAERMIEHTVGEARQVEEEMERRLTDKKVVYHRLEEELEQKLADRQKQFAEISNRLQEAMLLGRKELALLNEQIDNKRRHLSTAVHVPIVTDPAPTPGGPSAAPPSAAASPAVGVRAIKRTLSTTNAFQANAAAAANTEAMTPQQRMWIGLNEEEKAADIELLFSRVRHNKYEEVVQMLDVNGVDINAVDVNGNSILGIACQNGRGNIVKLCLSRRADVNHQNRGGHTPLHFCSAYGFLKLGGFLISNGANTRIRNGEGYTPFQGLGGEVDPSASVEMMGVPKIQDPKFEAREEERKAQHESQFG